MPHSDILGSFLSFQGLGYGRKVALWLRLVWLAVVWAVWNSRNDIIFAEGTPTAALLIDKVKFSSWKWFLGKSYVSLCSFYEWEAQTVLCWFR